MRTTGTSLPRDPRPRPSWSDVAGTDVDYFAGQVFTQLAGMAEQLRARRLALGLRQQDVAELMNVNRVTVLHVERGKHASVETVARYAHAVGLCLSLVPPPRSGDDDT